MNGVYGHVVFWWSKHEGENERGEKKGKGEKREGGKRRGKKIPQQGSNPRPSTLQLPPEVELHAKPTYITNLDCHELSGFTRFANYIFLIIFQVHLLEML